MSSEQSATIITESTTTTAAVITPSKVPNQIEEALNHRLRQYAHKQCDDIMKQFADCSRDKLLSVVFKCIDHQNDLVRCMKQYVNDENKEKLRQAYLRGDMMKKRTYNDYQSELEERLKNEEPNNQSV